MPESAVEAYRIGVSFVANAQKVIGPVDEMIRAMDRIKTAQNEVNSGFTSMVQSLSGARRVATSLADEMERAARAARSIKPAPGAPRGARYDDVAPSGPTRTPSRTAASVAVAASTNSGSGSSNYMSPFPAAAEGLPGRLQLLLPPPAYRPPSTALTIIPGQGDSRGNGATFRRSSYVPDFDLMPDREWSVPFGPDPESRSARKVRVARERADAQRERNEARAQDRKDRADEKARVARERAEAKAQDARARALRAPLSLPHLPTHHHAMTIPEVLAGYAAFHLVSSGFEQAGDYDQVFLGMAGTPGATANMPAIKASAQRALRDNDLLTPVDAARMAAEAYNLSGGSINEQAGLVAVLNKSDRAFQLLGKSPEDAFKQAQAFVKANDIMNKYYNPKTGEFDAATAMANTDNGLKMIFANSQFMNGQSFLTFAKSSGRAGQNMSPEGILNAAHFIDVNPARASQAIKSFESLFGGNHVRMAKKDAAYFKSLGLIGKNGQFVDQTLRAADPIGWITAHFAPLMKAHPELLDYIQRMNIADLAGETYGASGNIARQQKMAMLTSPGTTMAALAGGSKAAQSRLEVSFERFEFVLGKFAQGPGVDILNKLTDTLNNVSAYMVAHPKDMDLLAKQVGSLIGAMTGAAVGVAKISTIIPKWLWPILLGAAGGARVGGVYGAIGGAALGVGYDLGTSSRSGGPGMMQPATGMTSLYDDGMTVDNHGNIIPKVQAHITVNIDGKQVAKHVQDIQTTKARQATRSTTAAPDWGQYLQMPNSQGGAH